MIIKYANVSHVLLRNCNNESQDSNILLICLFVLGLGVGATWPTLIPLPDDSNRICRVPLSQKLPLCY